MAQRTSQNRKDKIVIVIALLFFLAAISILHFGKFWRRSSHGIPIGEVTKLVNDTRFRDDLSLTWEDAEDRQPVSIGDAVFTGQGSTMTVEMKSGQALHLNENSLVVFRNQDDFILPDLSLGSVTIAVNGKVRIGIQGRVRTIEGRNAMVRLSVRQDEQIDFQVPRGEAKLLPLAKAPAEVPRDLRKVEDLVYNWRLHDLYEFANAEVRTKPTPEKVTRGVGLSWASSPAERPAALQWDSSVEFSHPIVFGGGELKQVRIGDNFWRASYDGNSWSQASHFHVTAKFHAESPRLKIRDPEVPLVDGQAAGALSIEGEPSARGFLVEESADVEFSTPITRRFWTSGRMSILSYRRPGKYFYRARSVNASQELSDWSVPESISVYLAAPPLAPRLVKLDATNATVGDEIGFEYSSEAQESLVTVRNEKGIVIAEYPSATGTFRPEQPGHYRMSSVSINGQGLRSRPSKTSLIRVKPQAQIAAAPEVQPQDTIPAESEVPESLREPAQEKPAAQTRMPSPLQPPPEILRNDTYKSSFMSLQGFLWTLQSSQQYINRDEAPIATGAGIRGIYWKDHMGLEGIIKSQVLSVNPAANRTMVRDIEARYHYRFFTPFPFGWARELQISFYGGVEDFANKGNTFANRYTLLTVGNMLEFPVATNWSMGGEFIFGYGFDATRKYEVTGHFKYYLNPKWSLGFGYLLHFFLAGSESSAPPGSMPYKEGYTEGFSTIDYHF